MKNFSLLILLGLFIFVGCSEDYSEIIEEPEDSSISNEAFKRLCFVDEFDLENAILGGGVHSDSLLKAYSSQKFISMLSMMPGLKNASGEEMSYYEGLGFDTLVPNLNFAALLNPDGELEIGGEVIRIAPVGTYRFLKEYEEEFNQFILDNPDFSTTGLVDEIIEISDNIVLYNTFKENPNDYEMTFEGEFDELVGYEDDDYEGTYSQLKSSSELDINSFTTFKADRKTVVGSAIQSIIGSKRNHTLEFNSKRRLKGSFYFYNYGVYAEIGVTGETQKKNWIGWSGTSCDELRVGWRNVEIKRTIPDFQKQTLKGLEDMVYFTPKSIFVNGKLTRVATLLAPDFDLSMKEKLRGQGIQAFLKWARKSNESELEKAMNAAEALIVASRTEIYYYSSSDVIKYNTDKYTHVFDKSWMDFEIGWSNQRGFFVNNINSNNADNWQTYLKTVYTAFNSHRGSLEGGSVYVCGRFGNTWRGMKIVK